MNEQPKKSGWGLLIGAIVISVTVVGYFTGLQAPMSRGVADSTVPPKWLPQDLGESNLKPGILPATTYSQMAELKRFRKSENRSRLTDLKPVVVAGPTSESELATTSISIVEKNFALATRALNRAFNGAPPTVPHPIDQVSTQSCMACHGEGFATSTLRASKMSHQFLENCTQCHVEQNPQHMEGKEFRETTFVGLPAPTEGPRAYPGAPPQIPHTTWMRVDCLSCHGPAGAFGIRTTHPWRDNCLQCHAPSSELDQVKLDPTPGFLQPLKIEN